LLRVANDKVRGCAKIDVLESDIEIEGSSYLECMRSLAYQLGQVMPRCHWAVESAIASVGMGTKEGCPAGWPEGYLKDATF
jgi:hypothetical protein